MEQNNQKPKKIQDKKAEPSKIKSQNKMLRKCLKNLVHRLLHQFRSQSYDSNSILFQYFQQLKQSQQKFKKQSQQKGQASEEDEDITEKSSTPSSNENVCTINYWKLQQYQQLIILWPDISVFIWELARSPKWYVQMLRNQQIYAQETQCIDMHVFTTKIYKKVMSQASKMTTYTKRFQQICADQIYFFLQEVSLQICACFKAGQKIVLNEISFVTSVVQKSQIITFYLLYKIFKDTALICRHRIISGLQEGIFRNIEVDVVQSFAHYIIEKYQVLDMKMEEQKKYQEKVSITQRILNSNHVKWRQAIREDGQIGVLVELKDQNQQGRTESYMLMFDDDGQMSVVNSNSISKQWKVCKNAEENYDIKTLVKSKKGLAEKMRNTSTKAPMQMTLLQNVGVLGGSLGKCLAQIDTYDNVGQFMTSLSKRTIIGGSFNYLLTSVPLLGYVFVTGGFTYTFYYIFSNQYANSDKKLRELRNVTLGSAASVGSGLIGAAVGQTLIPVPVLGAFVGGLVGGFIGQFGARVISNAVETERFKQTIQQMLNSIQPKGYWQVNQKTLDILQIKKQKFYETIPEKLEHKMNCNKIWLTLIFFTLLCFHESKNRIKAMQKIMKQQKKLQKKLSEYQIIEANQNMRKTEYQPSVDFMCILQFFQYHHIIYIDFHDEITFILNKIFAKLK